MLDTFKIVSELQSIFKQLESILFDTLLCDENGCKVCSIHSSCNNLTASIAYLNAAINTLKGE